MVVFYLAILLMSVVIHEFAHGWMAFYLGDHTAKDFGRLTLNPLKHLDPIGSFVVPFLLFTLSGGTMAFGWAKPVPYNPRNLSDQKFGQAKVAIAGPVVNLLMAIAFGVLMRLMPEILRETGLWEPFGGIVLINIVLAVFNLVPIPPLDGSKVLFDFLPYSMNNLKIVLERYGVFFLLFFIFFAFQLIQPIIFSLFELIVGVGIVL